MSRETVTVRLPRVFAIEAAESHMMKDWGVKREAFAALGASRASLVPVVATREELRMLLADAVYWGSSEEDWAADAYGDDKAFFRARMRSADNAAGRLRAALAEL